MNLVCKTGFDHNLVKVIVLIFQGIPGELGAVGQIGPRVGKTDHFEQYNNILILQTHIDPSNPIGGTWKSWRERRTGSNWSSRT